MVEFLKHYLEENAILFVLSSARNAKQTDIEIIHHLRENGYSVLVITTDMPSTILKKTYEKDGIDTSGIWFIDTVTRYAMGTLMENSPHFAYTTNPDDLTSLSIYFTQMITDIPDGRVCIVFNSINTVLIHMPSEKISRFIHFITNKLRLQGAMGIFLGVKAGLDPKLLTQLSVLMDDTIDLTK